MIMYLHFFGGMKGSIQQVLTIRGDEEDLRKIFYFSLILRYSYNPYDTIFVLRTEKSISLFSAINFQLTR